MICRFEPTDIPALRKKDSKKEEEETDDSTDPSVEDERGRLVQQSLVFLIRCQRVAMLNSLFRGTYSLKPRGMDADSLERGLLRLWRIHPVKRIGRPLSIEIYNGEGAQIIRME